MFLKKIKDGIQFGIRKFDLFPTTQFIKFNKQSQYTTVTGGLVSIGLIIVIILLFYSRGLQTISRSIINSSTSSQMDTDPPRMSVIASPDGGFMFSVGIFGLNMNDPNLTYFNIRLYQSYFSPIFNPINSTQVPLVPCTKKHFDFNDDIVSQYEKFNLSTFLCPPIGYQFNVGGRFTSQIFTQFSIIIQKCDNSTVSTCITDAQLNTLQQSIKEFTLGVPFVNTIVNPNSDEYLVYALEARNYFGFTTDIQVSASAQIAQYEIDTDVSIMPYASIQTDLVTTIPELFTYKSSTFTSGIYAKIDFRKSSSTITYSRSFAKVDDYFSYIGGLVGSALVIFFMMKQYSERSFLIDIAAVLLQNDHIEFSLKGFNFLQNVAVICRKVFDFIGINVGLPKAGFFIQAMQQMEEQLDILFLVNKISFLEEAISSILSEHQMNALYLRDKKQLSKIKQERLKYKVVNSLSDHYHQCPYLAFLSYKPQEIARCKQQDQQGQKIRQQLVKMKSSVQKVIEESKSNNQLSQRIQYKIDPVVIERLGITDHTKKILVEMTELMSSQNSASNLRRHSINAVANEYQFSQSNQMGRDIIVDSID